MMPNTPQGQVTLAVIATKLDAVMDSIKQQGEQLKAIQSCQDKWDHIPGDLDDLKKTVGDQGDDLIAVKTRVDNIGVFNGALAIIAGAIGSLFNPKI